MKGLFVSSFLAMLAISTPLAAADPGGYASAGGGYAVNDSFEDTLHLGASAGYDFGVIRSDIGYDAFLNNDFEGHMPSINAYYEVTTLDGVTPYVGFGVGYLFLSGDNAGRNDDDLAIIGSAGLRFNISDNLGVDGGYRYVRSDAEVRGSHGSQNFESHVVNARLVYQY